MKVNYAPWKYAGGGQIIGADGEPVAYLAGRLNDGADAIAGRRMAAAPELYEALEAAEGHLADDLNNTALHPVSDCPVLRKVRSALAKARGDLDK